MSGVTEVPLVIAFVNLNSYTAQAARLPDLEVAGVMALYYELVGAAVGSADGRVVKFIGDAALVVFPPEQADRGVLALLELKLAVDNYMVEQRWDCHLIARVHHGTAAVGEFGAAHDLRYDVLGKAVNVAARLESGGVALSAEAFRQLSPEMRKHFKKHTPPITYIRVEDAHRPRWAKH